MHSGFLRFLVLVGMATSLLTWAQSGGSRSSPKNGGDFSNNPQAKKVPTREILVKGAWSSASDSVTPHPEDGSLVNGVYSNRYFGLSYPLPSDWTEKYKGPPPSDSGYYVLAQLRPAETFKGPAKGLILITAQDMFFTLASARTALEMINYTKEHLTADYKVELPPAETKITGHSFIFFAYSLARQSCIGTFWQPRSAATHWNWC